MDFFNKIFRSSKRNNPVSSAQESNGPQNATNDIIDFDLPRPDELDLRCVTVLVVGAGSRGMCYTYYAVNFSKRMKIVGVADPRPSTKETLKLMHHIDEDKFFDDWREAAELEKFADAVIIATPDRLHKDPAIAFAKKGYQILLEKPMAVTPEDCNEIVNACKENGVMLAVGHVMRYHPVSRKIRDLLDSGVIGDIVHIQHMEPVGYWHFAHSFVRGNWRNEEESSFSLLAKSCHDIDLICYWMGSRRCVKVSSFGTLSHFTKENKPEGASSRCLDCSVEETCPYSAQKVYLKETRAGLFRWPTTVVCSDGVCDIESLTQALKTGPYGRCVYECDNDVASNQVVNMEFEGGRTAAFTMMAFTQALGARKTSIYGSKVRQESAADHVTISPAGTSCLIPGKAQRNVNSSQSCRGVKGELRCNGGGPIEVFDFVTNKTTQYPAKIASFLPMHLMSHGGADYYLIDSFISAVASNDPSLIMSGPDDTLRSHLLVFQAEKSRRESCVVHIDHKE